MLEKCQGKRADGKPCAAKPRPGSTYCPWHDPELAERRREWSAKGGAQRSNAERAKKELPSEPLSNAEAHAYLSLAFRRAMVGKMDAPMLNALAGAAKALAELSKAVDLEDQLADMRQKIVELSERRPA